MRPLEKIPQIKRQPKLKQEVKRMNSKRLHTTEHPLKLKYIDAIKLHKQESKVMMSMSSDAYLAWK